MSWLKSSSWWTQCERHQHSLEIVAPGDVWVVSGAPQGCQRITGKCGSVLCWEKGTRGADVLGGC